MKYSRQRELILKAVQTNPIHPTADDVYGLLKAENPNLSLGTVYRNLNKFVQTGALIKITLPGEPDRFDGNTHDHYHLQCVACSEILDIPIDGTPNFASHALDGFEILSYDVKFQGLCQLCQKSETCLA